MDWKDKILFRNEYKNKRIKNIIKEYFINNDAYLKILSEMDPNKNGFKLLNLKGLYEDDSLEKK